MHANRTTSSKRKHQVFLVDDHPILRQGWKELLKSTGELECCGEAEDAPEALRRILDSEPDLVILDITLKKGDGLELIKQLRAQECRSRLLVCSMHDETLYAERALHAGARGYVSKEATADDLLAAIRKVLAGKVWLSESMSQRVLRRIADGDQALEKSPIDQLSDRELEVLGLIGQGLSTREIAENLNLSVKTIDTYRENLKAKLNLPSANELIRYAVVWTQQSR
jgi:DNA-binding NarL/FixJ family response regulator